MSASLNFLVITFQNVSQVSHSNAAEDSKPSGIHVVSLGEEFLIILQTAGIYLPIDKAQHSRRLKSSLSNILLHQNGLTSMVKGFRVSIS
jgi:hypothetical protein